MYNGIGLQTARGSGTNGYIQTNKFFVKPRTSSAPAGGPPKPPLPGQDAAGGGSGMRKPNKELLEHDRKRQVQLRLLVLRDALEDQGYTEAEIEERVEEARKAAEIQAAAAAVAEDDQHAKGFMGTQSHHVAARKEKQLEQMRDALGLDADGKVKKKEKKEDVHSDVESGELVPGKDMEELDTDGKRDGRTSRNHRREHAKAGKKERADKSRHGTHNDTETDHKRAKPGKTSHHDSDTDVDSDHGKKKTKHGKSNRDDGKKSSHLKKSEDEKVKRSKYKDDSYSESESDQSYSDSEDDFNHKLQKSTKRSTRKSKDEKPQGKAVKKGKHSDTSESDSDADHVDRSKRANITRHGSDRSKRANITRHGSEVAKSHIDVVKKDQHHGKSKSNLGGDDYKDKMLVKNFHHDSEDERPHSKILRKGKHSEESQTDSETYVKEKKPAKPRRQESKNDEQAQKAKEKEDNFARTAADKRKRHDTDSDSDGYAYRKRQLGAQVKEMVKEKGRVISSSESESSYYSSSSSSSSSDSDLSVDSRENREPNRGLKNGNAGKYAGKASYIKKLEERTRSKDGRNEERKEQEKQNQREEERKELEKQKQKDKERKELEKQSQRGREEERQQDRGHGRQRGREEERQQDREHEKRGGDDVETEYKRKVGDDRYDPNSSKVGDDEDRYNQSRYERRHEEHLRHITRDADGHNFKRSRYDDSYHHSRRDYEHSRRDYEHRYSRDEYRDRRHR